MADELKATPVKHDWVLSVANALKKGRDYANNLDVPVLGPAGDLLVGKAPEGLERIAYDEPLTTGSGWTTKLRPEAIDLGFMAADMAPVAKSTVRALRRGAEEASTAAVRKITGNAAATPHGVIDEINQMNLLPAMAGKSGMRKTKFQKAHEEAQRNAALPIEEGGLGLPPDNTAMQRAEAMGARDWYHGTERLDRLLEKDSLNPKRATSGPMPFGTDERELASNYAANKSDTSRIADDEGDMSRYFSVSPKDLGMRGTNPYSVEQSYHFLSPEKKKELLDNYYRVGYADPEQGIGDFTLHPEGVDGSIASRSHLDYVLNREAKGNPLTAMRNLWGESGELYDNPEALADIYRVAGYPHEISQANAPWYKANGVFTGKVMTQNPLMSGNSQELIDKVVPHLENAFQNDRTKTREWGADMWDKNSRYTPKEWVSELRKDLESGENSYVWTSIPDKVTSELRNLGYDSIIDVSGKGGGKQSEVIIPFEPNQVRSRFAAFDPKKRDSTNLLAGVGAFVPGTGSVVDALREEPQQQ